MRFEHLYVHVPFCTRRCVYCDFSIAVRPRVPVEEYLSAVDAELRIRHADSTFDLHTVYLGGGTPSKLGGEGVTRLLDALRRRTTLRPDAEVTLEANPEDVTPAAVAAWRDAGVNRLSIGVQSFDDRVLTWMHRTHDAAAARRAIAVAREHHLDNVSIDLIFATPADVPRDWARDLEAALALDLPHVSVYGLALEPRAPLARRALRREASPASDQVFATEFLRAHDELTGAGYEHYEVSNYGRAGRHARHNWAYWLRQAYAGIGPSAHEFDGAVRRWNLEAYSRWLARVTNGGDPEEGRERLSGEQAELEIVYLQLRTTRGIAVRPGWRGIIERWVASGWAARTPEAACLTAQGWLRLDSLVSALTAFRNHC